MCYDIFFGRFQARSTDENSDLNQQKNNFDKHNSKECNNRESKRREHENQGKYHKINNLNRGNEIMENKINNENEVEKNGNDNLTREVAKRRLNPLGWIYSLWKYLEGPNKDILKTTNISRKENFNKKNVHVLKIKGIYDMCEESTQFVVPEKYKSVKILHLNGDYERHKKVYTIFYEKGTIVEFNSVRKTIDQLEENRSIFK